MEGKTVQISPAWRIIAAAKGHAEVLPLDCFVLLPPVKVRLKRGYSVKDFFEVDRVCCENANPDRAFPGSVRLLGTDIWVLADMFVPLADQG